MKQDPILALLGLEDLLRDAKYLELVNCSEYQELKILWEEQSPEYWNNIQQMGDFVELGHLRSLKAKLRNKWREIYGQPKEDQQEEVSEATESLQT